MIPDREKTLAKIATLRQSHEEEKERGEHGEALLWLLDVAVAQASVGDNAGAEATSLDALHQARELGEPPLLSRTLCHLGTLLEQRGERARAEPLLREAFEVASRADAPTEAGKAAVVLGLCIQHRGGGEEARSWLSLGIARLGLLDAHAVIARCHLGAIDHGQSDCCADIWDAAGEAVTAFLQREAPGQIDGVRIWHEGKTRRINVTPARPLGPVEQQQLGALLEHALGELQRGFEALS